MQPIVLASVCRCAIIGTLMFGLLSESTQGQTTGNSFNVPQTRLAPIGTPPAQIAPSMPPSGTGMNPGVTAFPPNPAMGNIGNAPFDPYSGGPASGFIAPINPSNPAGMGSMLSSPPLAAPQGGVFSPAPPPGYGGPVYGGVAQQPPPLFGSNPLFGGVASSAPLPNGGYGPAGAYGTPGTPYPSTAFPNTAPSSLFPGGLLGPTQSFSPNFDPYRLIQRARFQHTYMYGNGDSDSLGINDTDVALAFAIPQILASTQPLFIAPSFSVHLWDGPNSSTGADLPGSAYSAFLDFAWQSDPIRIVGADLGLSVGVFSQFDVFDDDSLRIRGKGLGTFRVTPASTFKVGVYYYDRVKVKLLPAVGFFWRPDPFTKVDLFFPQPKYSRYLSTVGTNDVWWYFAGDYGGGSWTVERESGIEDQVDLNDIRLSLGFEWGPAEKMRLGRRTWHFEIGYVFDREIAYRRTMKDIKLDDAFMFRLGLGY